MENASKVLPEFPFMREFIISLLINESINNPSSGIPSKEILTLMSDRILENYINKVIPLPSKYKKKRVKY